ncbi:MAG: hypothetical protein CSA35_02250 [Dethiosulfovibrio peptidovorans]|nr:MAG: hypothetical protein CSA35_02250 [Dethiosulfovibrio peptidovorans]
MSWGGKAAESLEYVARLTSVIGFERGAEASKQGGTAGMLARPFIWGGPFSFSGVSVSVWSWRPSRVVPRADRDGGSSLRGAAYHLGFFYLERGWSVWQKRDI